jgi:signal transduction histidine kinase
VTVPQRWGLRTHLTILASLLLVFSTLSLIHLWIRTNAQNRLNAAFDQDLALLAAMPVLRQDIRQLNLSSGRLTREPQAAEKRRLAASDFERSIHDLEDVEQNPGLKSALVELDRRFQLMRQETQIDKVRELREDMIEQFGVINDRTIFQLQNRLAAAERTFYSLFVARVVAELFVSLGLALYVYLAIVRPIMRLEASVGRWKLGQAWSGREDGAPELRALNQHFAAMADRLNSQFGREKELNQFKTKLVSLVSHEFGNALAVMQNATFLLREKETPAQLRESAALYEMIAVNISSLNQAVNNLLNIARIEAGKLAMDFSETNVGELLSSSMRQFSLLSERKGLRVALDLPDGLPPLRADPGSLSLVVSNLLNNAIKYTPPKGAITLGVVPDGGQFRVFVADSGIGISKEDQQRILTGYYRAESGRIMSNKGFGLGLSLARQILEAHGTALELESAPGKGSRFSFRLPAWKS